MKRLFTVFAAVLLTASVFAQSPEKMSYQAVIRNSSDVLVANTQIGMEINILQGLPTGTVVYTETQTPTTNANGLISIEIGLGTGFSAINWANGPYFIETKTDPTGGTNYTIIGTSQLLSVPYALYAKTAEIVTGGIAETDPVFGASVASGISGADTINWNNKLDSYTETQNLNAVLTLDNSAGNKNISNLANPVNSQDAVTKAYLDELIGQLYEQAVLRVKDIDGNLYYVVKIGSLYWFAENLKTTRYNDGTPIPLVTDNTAWSNLTTPGYCWYNNDQATYGNTYGALYNWYIVNTGHLCPTGWHVPTEYEWTYLTNFLGGVAGGKLKEAGTAHWLSPNTGATNETGFTALPGGSRDPFGGFFSIGYLGYWWSATGINIDSARIREMHYNDSNLSGANDLKRIGISVRCVRD